MRKLSGSMLGLIIGFLIWGVADNIVLGIGLGIILGGIWDIWQEEK